MGTMGNASLTHPSFPTFAKMGGLDSGMRTLDNKKISEVLEGYVDRGQISGAVAMVERDGEIQYRGAFGFADLSSKAPISEASIFRVASMSKPVTSVAALMLMEDGVIRLDDPITKWLPEFLEMQVLDDPSAGTMAASPARNAITVHDLLTQRSGIPYPFTCEGALAAALGALTADVRPAVAPDRFIEELAKLPLMFEPGSRWHYGFSTDVLGVLIARASKSSFPGFLQERIFGPLGMVDTAFDVPAEKLDRLTTAYVRVPDSGELVVFDPPQGAWSKPPIFPSGGAGLVSSAADYMAFARMLTNGGAVDGGRMLAPETVALLKSNVLSAEERGNEFFGFADYWRSTGFGLGVSMVVSPKDHPIPTSEGLIGWPGAFGTSWFSDASKGLTGVILFQEYWSALTISNDFQEAIYTSLA
jgi:CubicO group peptidase (beta-lactamase class C family)